MIPFKISDIFCYQLISSFVINFYVIFSARFGIGGKGKKGKKKGAGLGGILAIFGAKMLAIKAYFLAGLFLLAKKALIISKIALLIAGIIAVKKLVASKHAGHGESVSHVYAGHGGGHDAGWSGGYGGGGWDKRSADSHDLAYNSYAPK